MADNSDLSSSDNYGDRDGPKVDDDDDDDSSDGEFAFEDSFNQDDPAPSKHSNEGKNQDPEAHIVRNKEYDEALDVSASTIESHQVIGGLQHDDGDSPRHGGKQSTLVHDASYDEALEVSASTIGSVEMRTPSHKAAGNLSNLTLDTKQASPGSGRAKLSQMGHLDDDEKEAVELSNQPWDEAHTVSSDEAGEGSLDTEDGLGFSGLRGRQALDDVEGSRGDSPPAGAAAGDFSKPQYGADDDDDDDDGSKTSSPAQSPTHDGDSPMGKSQNGRVGGNVGNEKLRPLAGGLKKVGGDDGSDSGGSESSSDSDGGAEDRHKLNTGYKPKSYEHLSCSAEVRDLFQYIGRYKPPRVELETRLRCFIPDFIPAVGDIDAFIKIPRPDQKPDDLGLVVVDEPAAIQSDATVLELQLRSISKKSDLGEMSVRSIERADKNPKEIAKWIDSIEDLHRRKPPPQVHYSKPMPDIEQLMQVWPEKFEELLRKISLPTADMDLNVHEFARVVCSLMDIPVHASHVESLHVLFTLFLEFRNNSHFRGMMGAGSPVAAAAGPGDNHQQQRQADQYSLAPEEARHIASKQSDEGKLSLSDPSK